MSLSQHLRFVPYSAQEAYAASCLGHRTIGIDINPVMTTLARGRCIARGDALWALAAAEEFVASISRRTAYADDPLSCWFAPSAVAIIRNWRNAAIEIGRRRTLAEEGFVMAALFEAARQLARSYRSKNPTWVKVPLPSERAHDRSDVFTRRVVSCGQSKAQLCPTNAPEYVPVIELGSSTDLHL